ncbi:hypothetical protein ES332_D05G360500v1 [Gossypium tomentosum]|uniref:Uncharacterized protein n=1 Tax=Gossypium tomentosum TaxID=34277 RepID=A0A5D2L4A0_GOSTO|nr:hypothetical protein ES332_D05G360500v1 [Gossypium tomentosum]
MRMPMMQSCSTRMVMYLKQMPQTLHFLWKGRWKLQKSYLLHNFVPRRSCRSTWLQEYMAVISYQFTVCISVVEYMAAEAIPIAHNSAGPKMDIVLDEDGHKQDFLLKM